MQWNWPFNANLHSPHIEICSINSVNMPVCLLKLVFLYQNNYFSCIFYIKNFIAKDFTFFYILCPTLDKLQFIKYKPWTVECGTEASERLWALTSQYYWASETQNRADMLPLLHNTCPPADYSYSTVYTVQSSLCAGQLVSSLKRSRLISSAASTSRRRSVFISKEISTVFYNVWKLGFLTTDKLLKKVSPYSILLSFWIFLVLFWYIVDSSL